MSDHLGICDIEEEVSVRATLSTGTSRVWMVHSCGEGVNLVELNIPVGQGLSTLRGLRTETQSDIRSLGIDEWDFRGFGY